MRLTRRSFGLLAAAAGFAGPGLARADALPPVILAEGGAAEERIEDTRSALDLAIVQGCDFLQVNLVPTKEGALIARRDNELSASTNVATLPQFADRKTTKTIDGDPVTGWFAEDFTLDEIRTLACREAQPKLRPQNLKWNDKEPPLSLPEVLQMARDGCVKTARTVGVAARLMRTRYFDDLGLDVVGRLAAELTTEGYVSPAAAIWVQALEPDTLVAFGRLSPLRRMQLIEPDGGPDAPAPPMIAADGLIAVKAYAEAIGPDQSLLMAPGAVFPAPTTLALDAHNAGLQVFARSVRAENAFLPEPLRKGDRRSGGYDGERGDVDRLLTALFSDRIDGLATDVPDAADKARAAVMDAAAQAPARRG